MAISKRHHYLPQFYLNGFTNDYGTFAIFDCKNRRLSSKEFVPKAKFYDSRNLVEFDGVLTDIPEQMYSSVDYRHAELFKNIQSQRDVLNLTLDELFTLQEFILTTFWRLPSQHEAYDREYVANPAFTKNFKIIHKDTGVADENVTKSIIFSEPFKKSIKPFIALARLATENITDFKNWRFLYNFLGNNIFSDNPVVFRNDPQNDPFSTEFIFPLSKHHLLVKKYKFTTKEQIPKSIMAAIQVLLFSQGEIYCCCPDREFLESAFNAPKDFKDAKELLFHTLESDQWLSAIESGGHL